jgi:hypothetical protein
MELYQSQAGDYWLRVGDTAVWLGTSLADVFSANPEDTALWIDIKHSLSPTSTVTNSIVGSPTGSMIQAGSIGEVRH